VFGRRSGSRCGLAVEGEEGQQSGVVEHLSEMGLVDVLALVDLVAVGASERFVSLSTWSTCPVCSVQCRALSSSTYPRDPLH